MDRQLAAETLGGGNEGLGRAVRRRRSAEDVERAKAAIAARKEAAAEHGGDPKSDRGCMSIRQLWLELIDDFEVDIDSVQGPTLEQCIDFVLDLRTTRIRACLALEEREGRGHGVITTALYGLPKQVFPTMPEVRLFAGAPTPHEREAD